MTPSETSLQIQRQIVVALRHGALDQFQVAADIGQAPFRVRAELRLLRRDRLVSDRIGPDGHKWELTARGLREAFSTDQMRLA